LKKKVNALLKLKKCLYYQDCLKDKGDCTKKNYVIQKLEENLVIRKPLKTPNYCYFKPIGREFLMKDKFK